MRSKPNRRGAWRAALLAPGILAVAGCSHVSWPWHRAPPPPPVPVHELELAGAGAAGFPQYWKRNTLLVDLSAAAGAGSLTVKPAQGATWPVRVAFRVRPGAFAVLEVRGDERVSLPINAAGSAPVDLELAPGVYTPKTEQLSVSWGPGAPGAAQ